MARPFHCESFPVRVTRSAFKAVPLMAMALAVLPTSKTQYARDPCGNGISSLYRVVEPRRADGGDIAQSALHLVGDREGRYKSRPLAPAYSAAARMGARLSLGWQVSQFAR